MRKLLLSLVGILLGLSAYAAETVLWEGTATLGWDQKCVVANSKCTNFKMNDEIIIHYTTAEKADYYSLGIIKGWWGKWPTEENKIDSSFGTVGVAAGTTSHTFYIDNEENLAKLKQEGFFLMGNGLTVSKIVHRESTGPIDYSILLKEPYTANEESMNLNFAYSAIIKGGGKVGGGILVEYEVMPGKNSYVNFLHEGDASNQYVWAEFTNPVLIEEEGKTYLVLNQETLDEIGSYSKNLIVQMGFVKVNLVKVIAPADMPEIPDLKSVTLDKSELSIMQGKTGKLTASVIPASATVTWTSSDTEVATVDAEGNITAVKVGTATITAAIEGAEATCAVTVTEPATIKIRWEDGYGQFYSDDKDISYFVGQTSSAPRMFVTTVPEDAKVKISFTMEPAKFASIYAYDSSKQAEISVEKAGVATITVKLQGYDLEESCTVTAKYVDTPTVFINPYSGQEHDLNKILAGNTVQLQARVAYPENVTDAPYADATYEWTSSDESIATVVPGKYRSGIVTTHKGGKVTISATAVVDGQPRIVGSREITVSGSGDKKYTFDFRNDRGYQWANHYGYTGNSGQPVNFTFKGDGVNLELTNGQYNPFAFGEGGDATFSVTDPNLRITMITASPVSSATAKVTFGDKVTCSTGTADGSAWTPDNEEGVESVTFHCNQLVGGITYWYVTLHRYATPEVALNKTALEGIEGESAQLTATVTPEGEVLPATTVWSSSDEAVATVDADGLVSFIAAGNAVITADYNGVKATCDVTVSEKSAIESIGEDAANAPTEYFNLQGVRVAADALTPGIYIVRQGLSLIHI